MFDQGFYNEVMGIVRAHEAEINGGREGTRLFGIVVARGNYAPNPRFVPVGVGRQPRIVELCQRLKLDGAFDLVGLRISGVSAVESDALFRELPAAAPRLNTLEIHDAPQLTEIPRGFFLRFPRFSVLDVCGCPNLKRLPTEIARLPCLEQLNLYGTGLWWAVDGRFDLSVSDRARAVAEAMAEDTRAAACTILLGRRDPDCIWHRVPTEIALVVCLMLWHSAGEAVWGDCRRRRTRLDVSKEIMRKRQRIATRETP